MTFGGILFPLFYWYAIKSKLLSKLFFRYFEHKLLQTFLESHAGINKLQINSTHTR